MSSRILTYPLGDRELGAMVLAPFTTINAAGQNVTPTGLAYRVREMQTKSSTTSGITPDENINGVVGLHRVEVDTNQGFFRNGADYVVELTAGTVDAVDVTGQIVGSFSIGAQSDGLVLLRTIKCHSGVITNVVSDREFDIDFEGIEENTDDFYKTQEFTMQSGVNSGVGRVCLSYDASKKRVLVQESYPNMPDVGAKFVIVPHERELRIYTAYIEAEWGIGQGVGDRISVSVYRDGTVLTDPASVVTVMQLTTWDVDTDVEITSAALAPTANSGVYRHQTAPGDARQPNEGLDIRAEFTIDGIVHKFQRTIYNYS